MNNCIFIGRLTRDPEIREVGDTHVCNFSIAVGRKYKTQGGESKDEVNFFDMVAWDKGAESINKFFKKGDPIVIHSSAKQESWTDAASGSQRNKIVFRVERFEFPPSNGRKEESQLETVGVGANGNGNDGASPGGGGAGDNNADEIPF